MVEHRGKESFEDPPERGDEVLARFGRELDRAVLDIRRDEPEAQRRGGRRERPAPWTRPRGGPGSPLTSLGPAAVGRSCRRCHVSPLRRRPPWS